LRDPSGRGRDSLGRDLTAASIADHVAHDPAVRRSQQALDEQLQSIYRDPAAAARAALDALGQRQGRDKVADEVARNPEKLGELRGRTGWFAGATAKRERAHAEHVAKALPIGLRGLASAEAAAGRDYVASVKHQQARDAIAIPALSKAAQGVLRDVELVQQAHDLYRAAGRSQGEDHAAREALRDDAVAAVWRAGRADPAVAKELDSFIDLARGRLGVSGDRPASLGAEHQPALDAINRQLSLGRDGVQFTEMSHQRIERDTARTKDNQARQEVLKRDERSDPERDRDRTPQRKPRDRESDLER
jgi:hypothetical protein